MAGDEPKQVGDLVSQARLEAGLRQVNERIDELSPDAAGWADSDDLSDYRCECGRPDCQAWIRLTAAEYDRIRRQDDRFAISLDHDTDGLEAVVERTDRYLVVDKLDAFEDEVADDPRGAPSS